MDPNRKRLYYPATDIEVLAGDHVQLRTLLLRKKILGRVSYIPQFTAHELAQQNKNADSWLIELSDGTATGWIYYPEDLQPPKRLTFIKRGDDDYKGMDTEELEAREHAEENQTTWLDSLIISLSLIALMAAVVFLFKSCS